ncbi:Aste57867_13999 [Aphanomyces stellatus]|uniref:Aste57867_13999 protein n=1 Tax=Aphanomyces stellatus TaxID=120398 RepID=A0A485L074_9STRA|nr:hypothetical protein As57867_013948 [Aphanomyces stellatus]VFT90829.1 Aste57867_13999 [Aphanomyces stellatus]
MTMTASAVLSCTPLLSCICAYQHGTSSAIVAVQRCLIISSIHGQLIRQPKQARPASLAHDEGLRVHIDDLPDLMHTRQSLVEAVLNHQDNSVELFKRMASHTHIRDVVVEYAVYYGRLDVLKPICVAAKRALCSDASRKPQFDVLDRLVIPTRAHLLRQLAAFQGRLDVLVFLNTTSYSSLAGRGGSELSYSDIEVAAERCHLRCLEYLVDGAAQLGDRRPAIPGPKVLPDNYFGLCQWSRDSMEYMTKHGIDRLNAADAAANEGHIKIAACLIRHGAPHVVDGAAESTTLVQTGEVETIDDGAEPTTPLAAKTSSHALATRPTQQPPVMATRLRRKRGREDY